MKALSGDRFRPSPWIWFWIPALFFHLLAAVQSTGFYHWDEHFQIVEFAGYKLGLTPADDLPWEYHSRLRSWLQPAVLVLIFRVLDRVGLGDPFISLFCFRLLTSFLGLASLFGLLVIAKKWFSFREWKGCLLLSGTLWFLPYLHARASSEIWGGAFFFIGFALTLYGMSDPKKARWFSFAAGTSMALAIESRFQVALLVAPFALWLRCFHRAECRGYWLKAVLGFALGFIVCECLNRWGYGDWACVPLNYFRANIIEDRASRWGTSPPWEYLNLVLTKAGPPISFFVVVSVLLTWAYRPKGALTWPSLVFVAAHSLIAHKELRFLFPLADAVPLFFCSGWNILKEKTQFHFNKSYLRGDFGVGAFGVVVLINLLFLICASGIPARTEISLYRFIYRNKVPCIRVVGHNPFEMAGLRVHFYRNPHLKIEDDQPHDSLGSDSSRCLVFSESLSFESPPSRHCHRVFTTAPSVAPELITRLTHQTPWSLFSCGIQQSQPDASSSP